MHLGYMKILLFHIKNTKHPIILKHLNYKKTSHNYTITLMYCVVLFTQANQSILPSPSEILRKFLLIYYDSKLALSATAYVEMKRGFVAITNVMLADLVMITRKLTWKKQPLPFLISLAIELASHGLS